MSIGGPRSGRDITFCPDANTIMRTARVQAITPAGFAALPISVTDLFRAHNEYRGWGGRNFADEVLELLPLLMLRQREPLADGRLSYGLRAEIGRDWSEYFSNGALIVAAYLLGLEVQPIPNSQNAMIGVE